MARDKLQKTCVVCELQKPLSAFLQITGAAGTTYGNVCSSCRGTSAGKKIIVPQTEDETSSSSTGLKIDAKSKVQAEQNQREQVEKLKETHREDLEKRLDTLDEKEEKKALTDQENRQHRENFLERKKQDSFLNFQSKKDPTSAVAIAGEKQTIERQNANVEQRKTSEDFSVQVLDQHTHQISRDNPFYKAWEALMGDAPIMNVRRHFLGAKSALNPNAELKEKVTKEEAKKQLDNYVKETWPKPPTGRGRT